MTTRTATKKPPAKKAAAPPAPAVHAVEMLLLADVDPHPKNVRRDLGDLSELTASIKADGVRNAIHVAVSGDGQRYVVLQGHRRREAAIAAGLQTIPAVIREDVTTDHAAVVEMLVENLLRADLTPIEEATAYEQLRLAGVTAPQIAKRTGRKRATVDARLALMKLPEGTRDKVHARAIALDEAAAIVEFASDEQTVRRLEATAGTHNFRWELQNAQRRREDAAKRTAALTRLAAEGVTVIDRPANYWDHSLGRGYGRLAGLTVADHAKDCEHHVAWVEDAGAVVYGCAQPKVHDHPDMIGGDNASDDGAEHAAAAEHRRQNEEDAATAAAVRKAFVVDVITGRRATLTDAAAAAVALAAAQYGVRAYCEANAADLAGWLEVTLPDEPDKSGYQAHRAHEEACEQLVLDALAKVGGHRALLAVLAEWSDGPLRSWHSWEPSAEDMRAGSAERVWLDVLQTLGYELTEWEAARLAAADQWAVDNPTADDQPDDVDEADVDERPVEDVDLDGYTDDEA